MAIMAMLSKVLSGRVQFCGGTLYSAALLSATSFNRLFFLLEPEYLPKVTPP